MQISVIIPCYNSEHSIEKTVKSIMDSGLKDYELILVDDGSTDHTWDICEKIAIEFDHVKSFRQRNSGVSSARNKGLREAEGEYIMFIDSDDLLLPINTDKISKLLCKHIHMIIFGMEFLYLKQDKIIKTEKYTVDNDSSFSKKALAENIGMLYRCNYLSSACNKLFRKDIISDCCFNENLINYEDLDFVLQVLNNCDSIAAITDVIYQYIIIYGEDHTPARIAKINNMVDNTNIIISKLISLADNLREKSGDQSEGFYEIALNIYSNLFRQKCHFLSLRELKKFCFEVKNNWLVQYVLSKNSKNDPFMELIINSKVGSIYIKSQYSKIRRTIVPILKTFLVKLKVLQHETI